VTYAGSIDEDILTEMGDPIKFIEIMTSDNKTIPLGAFPVSCDTVLTIRLDVKMTVTRVRKYNMCPVMNELQINLQPKV